MSTPVHTSKPSFSGGEFAPSLYARTDIAKYATGARTLRNFYVHPHGGISNRPGLHWVANAKTSGSLVRVLDFQFASDENYVIEFGTNYNRFYTNDAQIYSSGTTPYEISSIFAEADLANIRYAQSADVMFLVHPDYQPRELQRLGNATWQYALYAFTDGPFRLANSDTTLTMRVSAKTGNASLTASAAFFYATHASSAYNSGALMLLNHYIEGQAITQTFLATGTSTYIPCGGTWRIITHGTWKGTLKVEKSDDASAWTVLRQFSSNSDFNVDTYGSEDMSNGALPFYVRCNMQAYTSGSCSLDLTTDPYTHQGVAKILTYVSSTVVVVNMQRATGSTGTTSDWSEGAWSDYRGWPTSVTFAQDRLIFAGSLYDPQTQWMTQTGNYYSFWRNNPLVDSDGITINLPSQKLNQINGMVSLLQLLVFTTGAEWSIGSTSNNVLSPTSIQTKLNSYTGSSGVQPCVIVNRAIYVQSRGCVVRDLGYDLFTDTFTGANLSILSNHLFTNYNIVEMAYQQDPDSLVWAVRDDGKLLCMTYMREQEVLAWTWADTYDGDDELESICSIPASGYNEVWVVVNRGGQRMIERFDQRMKSELRADQFFVDSGIIMDPSVVLDSYLVLLMHMNGTNLSTTFTDEKGNAVTNNQDTLTKLLLHADGVDGATTFTDSSSGAKAITNTASYDSYTKVCSHFDGADAATAYTDPIAGAYTFVGTAQLSTAQKKFGSASLLLDGNSDYVTLPDSASWNFGTGAFTIDGWFRHSSIAGTQSFVEQYVDITHRVQFQISGNIIYFQIYDTSVLLQFNCAYTPTVDTWYHLALVRIDNGNAATSWRVFIDGVSQTLTLGAGAWNATVPDLASVLYVGIAGTSGYFNGYIDELRISKDIARWTSDFTPNAYPYGQVVTSTTQKEFGTASAWFDGSGSYLSLADSADWAFGTGTFTIDCWRYFENKFSGMIYSQWTDGSNYMTVETSTNSISIDIMNAASPQVRLSFHATPTLVLGQFYHIALTRESTADAASSWGIYVNGVRQTLTKTQGATWVITVGDYTGTAQVGALNASSDFAQGYIDELRISKGIARWTADFTPPTAAYTLYVTTNTSNYKFATASAYFEGGSYLSVPDSADWAFGTGDFTVDFWINLFSIPGSDCSILGNGYLTASSGFALLFDSDSPRLRWARNSGYSDQAVWAPTMNTWYHIAVVRSSSVTKIYINGIGTAGTADTYNYGHSKSLTVGYDADDGIKMLNCYIDELRISKGVARWTSDFTPPSAAYTIYGDPTKVVTGLAHLNGRQVNGLADGNIIGLQTVSNGTITLTDYATQAIVGLPYFADMETLNVEIGLADGTLQGRRIHISRVILRILNSRGGWLGPDSSNLHELLGDYDTSVDTSLYTGDVKIALGQGYKDGGRFFFRQIDPLPITILGVIPILTAGGTTLVD